MILRHQLGLPHRRLCLIHLRIGGAQRGVGGVDLLLGGGLLRQAALAARIGLGLEAAGTGRGQRGLRGGQLGGVVLLGPFQVDARIGELRLGHLQAALRLVARRGIGARIDLEQHVAGLDPLVVGHVQGDDGARHLRRHGDGTAIGVGVIGARLRPW